MSASVLAGMFKRATYAAATDMARKAAEEQNTLDEQPIADAKAPDNAPTRNRADDPDIQGYLAMNDQMSEPEFGGRY